MSRRCIRRRLDAFAAQASPQFKEIAFFELSEATGFDPAQPIHLELLVQRPIGPIEKSFTSFFLPLHLVEFRLLTSRKKSSRRRKTGSQVGSRRVPDETEFIALPES
jgi:transcriptional regulator of nitric oxide reductase